MKAYKYHLIILLYITLQITSCREGCEVLSCQNGGDCVNGSCTCPAGYSGEYCENSDSTSTGNCSITNTGTIKVVNTYGGEVRVFIDESNPTSNNIDLTIPLGATRYLYNLSVGYHTYEIKDVAWTTLDQAQVVISSACQTVNIGSGITEPPIPGTHTYIIKDVAWTTLDQAEVHINTACDTAVIGLPNTNTSSTQNTSSCSLQSWGYIKVINNSGGKVLCFIDKPNPTSNNVDMVIPNNNTRYLYSRILGSYGYEVKDISWTTIDQAQINILNACDTAVIQLQ